MIQVSDSDRVSKAIACLMLGVLGGPMLVSLALPDPDSWLPTDFIG